MGKVSLNLALALVLLADAVERLHVGDLHAVGQGEGPWALMTPEKAIKVGVGILKEKTKFYLVKS